MVFNTENVVTITEANRDFAKVARLVDETGAALVMKNDTPRYVILEWTQLNEDSAASSGEVFAVARRIIKDHLSAFKELAK